MLATLPSPLQVTCPVCYGDFEPQKTLSAGCEHFACKDCWRSYMKAYLDNAAKLLHLKCIGDGKCKVTVPLSVLYEVASEADRQTINTYEDRLAVESNPHASWCCAADCPYITHVALPPTMPEPLDVECKCGETFCFTCKEHEAHRPVDCETVRAWNVKNSAESENLTWIIANTKPCPHCHRPIQKNQGCMHMTCSQCRHEFCWLCQGDWKSHSDSTGGYYACNKCAPSHAMQCALHQTLMRKGDVWHAAVLPLHFLT